MKKTIFLIIGLFLISCSEKEEIESITNTKKSGNEFYDKFMETCMLEDSKMYSDYCECSYKLYNKHSIEEYDEMVKTSCFKILNK